MTGRRERGAVLFGPEFSQQPRYAEMKNRVGIPAEKCPPGVLPERQRPSFFRRLAWLRYRGTGSSEPTMPSSWLISSKWVWS